MMQSSNLTPTHVFTLQHLHCKDETVGSNISFSLVILLSIEHHEQVSINTSPQSKACLYFKLGLK